MNKEPKYPHPLPDIPPGHDYAKDSFWYRLRHNFRWKREIKAWEWYLKQRDKAALNGKPFPPNPIFQRKTTMPMPWTGKDEKPGRMPIH